MHESCTDPAKIRCRNGRYLVIRPVFSGQGRELARVDRRRVPFLGMARLLGRRRIVSELQTAALEQ
jgi:hypothetical protein